MYSERSPKGLLEASGFYFGCILKGLGGVWGGFWEVLGEFGGLKIVFLLDRVFGFRVVVAGAFGGVWAKSKVP